MGLNALVRHHGWLRAWLLILAAGMAAACARHHVAELKTAARSGVSLVYDAYDFSGCEIKTLPRLTSQENGTDIPLDVFPARPVFEFKAAAPGRGARAVSQVASRVTVIPLTDKSVKDFGQAYPGLARAAGQIHALLAKRPALPSDRGQIPDLAEVDCERAIIAKPQFFDFAAGSGIAFLTQYAQDFEPVTNEELTWVYQGLSADGRYYVDARLAVGHPTLDRGIDVSRPVPAARQAKYLRHIEQELDFFPESSFNPPLTDLKALVASLSLEGVSRTAQTATQP